MSELTITVDTREFERQAKAFAAVGKNIRPALARAINHTGDKARTQVTRALAEQTGASYSTVRKALRTIPAGGTTLIYRIVSTGGYMSLKEFDARQRPEGVRAAPWGKRRVFPHTFIVPSLGGHVFERTGSSRYPIRKLWGPAIPKEMVKDKARAAFEVRRCDRSAATHRAGDRRDPERRGSKLTRKQQAMRSSSCSSGTSHRPAVALARAAGPSWRPASSGRAAPQKALVEPS